MSRAERRRQAKMQLMVRGSDGSEYNLSDPKQARAFLKVLRFGPQNGKIESLTTSSGKTITIDDASDEQILFLCRQFANSSGMKYPSGGTIQ